MRRDKNTSQLQGCLLYGDRGETTQATFLGIEGDDRRVKDEARQGCRAAVENASVPSILEDIKFKIRNFFPSNSKNPNGTMLQLDGTVGINKIASDAYRSFFEYEVKPYSDSKGSPENVTVRPAFEGETEVLLQAFNQYNSKTIILGPKGEISFKVENVGSPELAYGSYSLLGQDGEIVAGIDFPVFLQKRSPR
jgi:hypothetical protein